MMGAHTAEAATQIAKAKITVVKAAPKHPVGFFDRNP